MSFVTKMFGLDGVTVAISGGGGAIATAMGRALLDAGARLAVWSRRAETVDAALETLDASDRIVGVVCDAGDETAVGAALEETVSALGMPSVLINAVGGNQGKGPFTEIDTKIFEEVLRINLVAGLVVPTKVVAKRWIDDGIEGSIINLASMSSFRPLSGVWAYDAAKAGVVNLTNATANEFAAHGIRVNGIAPGFFLGKQNRALLVNDDGSLTDRGRQVTDRTPFGRFGDVAELAGATLFLAAKEASGFVTGVTIPVDGGFMIDNI